MKRSPRLFSLALALILFATALTCRAQSEEDDDDSDLQDQKPFATLSLSFDKHGAADVTFHLDEKPREWNAIQTALGNVLHCAPSSFSRPSATAAETKSLGLMDPEVRAEMQQAYKRNREQSIEGRCANVLNRDSLLVGGEIRLKPLADVLAQQGKQRLLLYADHPKAGFEEHGTSALRYAGPDGTYTSYKFLLEQAGPEPIFSLRFGFRQQDILRIVGLPLAFLLLPICVVLWMRQAALKGAATDPTAAWFSYFKTLNWCTTATLLIWLVGRTSIQQGLQQLIDFALGTRGWEAATAGVLVNIVPPWLVYLICLLLSYKVFVQVRGHEWTRRDFVLNQLLAVGTVLVPLMFLFGGITFIVEYRKVAIILLFAAYVSWTLLLRAKLKASRMMPEALTTGELRDRVFELAKKCGVEIKQVFVMGSGKFQVANAYAAKNNIVMFTDYLLERLTKREVDAIAAHELSHLRYKHPLKLGLMLLFCVILGPTLFKGGMEMANSILLPLEKVHLVLGFNLISRLSTWPQIDLLVTIAGFAGFYFLSRRFERIADEGAVQLTGDAEALITGLLKVGRLNLMPIQWGKVTGSTLTHPSTLKRVEHLAKVGKVAPEKLSQLVEEYRRQERSPLSANQEFVPSAEGHYSVPKTEKRALTTVGAIQRATNNLWMLIAAHVLPPAIISLLVEAMHWDGRLKISAYVVGAILTLIGYSLLTSLLGSRGRQTMREPLARKFSLEGIDISGANSMLVGFAPDRVPRFYVSSYNWDLGFLLMQQDRMVFVGDQIRFHLKPAHILRLRLGQSSPGWWNPRRIYVDWRDEEKQRGGTFNLAVSGPCTLAGVMKQPATYLADLERWSLEPKNYKPAPTSLMGLESPVLGAVTSQSPRKVMPLSKMIWWAMLVCLVGLAVCVVLNISAWYVLSVVLLLRVYEAVPYLWYRDKAN